MNKIFNTSLEKHLKIREKIPPPPMIEQAKNVVLSGLKFAKNNFSIADDSIFLKRKEICDSCEFWDNNAFSGTGRCLKCGCSSLKLKLSSEKCPIGKWKEELT